MGKLDKRIAWQHLFSAAVLNFRIEEARLREMGATDQDFWEVVAGLINANWDHQSSKFPRDLQIYLSYRLASKPQTFSAIAKDIGLTPSRIRDIVKKMDRRIRYFAFRRISFSTPVSISFNKDRGKENFKKELYYQVLERLLKRDSA